MDETIKLVFQETTYEWVRNVVENKYDSWVSSFNDLSNMAGEAGDQSGVVLETYSHLEKTLEKIKSIKDRVLECDSFEEMNDFLGELVKKSKKSVFNLMEQTDELLGDELNSISVENDISNDLGNLKKSYDNILNSLRKLDIETLTRDVDSEDITYIFNNMIKEWVSQFNEWVINYPKILENVKDEVNKIVKDSTSFEEKRKAAELIEHYIDISGDMEFPNFSPEDIIDGDITGENMKQNFVEKIKLFYKGISIANELLNTAELCAALYTEIIEVNQKSV